MAKPVRKEIETPSQSRHVPTDGRSRLPMELSKVKGQTAPGQLCAYNQTRECFLGLRVVSGDFSAPSLHDWMSTLTPNSRAGIWMVPFRGVLAAEVPVPLDLLYLDEQCRVLGVVEFFPTFRVSPSIPPAASVLVLPSHSIFSSQTQPGDKLILLSAEEMEWRLEQLAETGDVEGAVVATHSSPAKGPVLVRDEAKKLAVPVPIRHEPKEETKGILSIPPVREEPIKTSVFVPTEVPLATPVQAPAQPQPRQEPGQDKAAPDKASQEKPWVNGEGRSAKSGRNWLQRFLQPEPPDPRNASREPLDGLVAHFFTGGAPQAHEIRDVSSTGLYVVTTERWYPGTVIRMTLSKPDTGPSPSDRSITIHARSVRWGNDGVGLAFVIEPRRKASRGPASPMDAVDSEQLGHFLKRTGKGKR
jgi:hypothetical protein